MDNIGEVEGDFLGWKGEDDERALYICFAWLGRSGGGPERALSKNISKHRIVQEITFFEQPKPTDLDLPEHLLFPLS